MDVRGSESHRHPLFFPLAIAAGLIVFGVAMRVVPHPWNLTPMGAIALFAGARLGHRMLAVFAPLAVMLISDAYLGFHAGMLFNYPSYLALVAIGFALPRFEARAERFPRPRLAGWLTILCGAVLGSLLFFAVTNLGAWVLSHGTDAYPKTWQGLLDCYLMGLPFYRNTLAGDVLFSGLLFGVYALGRQRSPSARTVSAG